MSTPSTIPAQWEEQWALRSLTSLMTEWDKLLRTVHRDLNPFMWQPYDGEAPMIYNWINPSDAAGVDTARLRDTIRVATTIAVAHGDDQEVMLDLCEYADAFRNVVDPQVFTTGTQRIKLGDTAYRVTRTGMQMVSVEMNGKPLLGVQFTTVFELDRNLI